MGNAGLELVPILNFIKKPPFQPPSSTSETKPKQKSAKLLAYLRQRELFKLRAKFKHIRSVLVRFRKSKFVTKIRALAKTKRFGLQRTPTPLTRLMFSAEYDDYEISETTVSTIKDTASVKANQGKVVKSKSKKCPHRGISRRYRSKRGSKRRRRKIRALVAKFKNKFPKQGSTLSIKSCYKSGNKSRKGRFRLKKPLIDDPEDLERSKQKKKSKKAVKNSASMIVGEMKKSDLELVKQRAKKLTDEAVKLLAVKTAKKVEQKKVEISSKPKQMAKQVSAKKPDEEVGKPLSDEKQVEVEIPIIENEEDFQEEEEKEEEGKIQGLEGEDWEWEYVEIPANPDDPIQSQDSENKNWEWQYVDSSGNSIDFNQDTEGQGWEWQYVEVAADAPPVPQANDQGWEWKYVEMPANTVEGGNASQSSSASPSQECQIGSNSSKQDSTKNTTDNIENENKQDNSVNSSKNESTNKANTEKVNEETRINATKEESSKPESECKDQEEDQFGKENQALNNTTTNKKRKKKRKKRKDKVTTGGAEDDVDKTNNPIKAGNQVNKLNNKRQQQQQINRKSPNC